MASTTIKQIEHEGQMMTAGIEPILRTAAWVSLAHGLLWGWLLFRWVTFGSIGWEPFDFENGLASLSPLVAYIVYGVGLVVDLAVGVMVLRQMENGRYATQPIYGHGDAGEKIADLLATVPLTIEKRLTY